MSETVPSIYDGCDKEASSKVMCGDCVHKIVCVYYGMLSNSAVVPITENCPYHTTNN